MDEYLTLISAKSDSKSSFSNRLAKTYYFGAEEIVYCALREISFSCEIKSEYLRAKSDQDKDVLQLALSLPIVTGGKYWKRIVVPPGRYEPSSLVDIINIKLEDVLGEKYKNSCKLYFNSVMNRIEFFLDGENIDPQRRPSLIIFPAMSPVSGLQNRGDSPEMFLLGANTDLWPQLKSYHKTHAIAGHAPSLNAFDLVMIYLSIVNPQSVSHDLVQLLDVIPKAKCAQGVTYYSYQVRLPKYKRLVPHLRSLSYIDVKLATETGQLLDIESGFGETRLTIHLLSEHKLNQRQI